MFKSPTWASLIDSKTADGVVQALSLARLASYGLAAPPGLPPQGSIGHCHGDAGVAAVARHARNITLCEAMYPLLHMLEVVMRNRIHHAFQHHFGALDWYDQGWLNGNHRAMVADARNGLSKRSKPHEPDRVIAQLSFGFWCGMLHSNYEHGPRAAWPALLTVVMPNVPKSWRTRFKIQGRVEEARTLRNRVFHHESITHLRDLRERHRCLLELLGWFSTDARGHIEQICRFKQAYGEALVLRDREFS